MGKVYHSHCLDYFQSPPILSSTIRCTACNKITTSGAFCKLCKNKRKCYSCPRWRRHMQYCHDIDNYQCLRCVLRDTKTYLAKNMILDKINSLFPVVISDIILDFVITPYKFRKTEQFKLCASLGCNNTPSKTILLGAKPTCLPCSEESELCIVSECTNPVMSCHIQRVKKIMCQRCRRRLFFHNLTPFGCT